MKRLAIALIIAAVVCVACGDGSLVLVGDGTTGNAQDTITIKGNIRDVSPQVAGARIVVFAYTGLQHLSCETNSDCDQTCTTCQNVCNNKKCAKQFDFDEFDKQRSVAVESDADPMEFTITQVRAGNVTVVFLQDDVSNPDGHIDDGDPFAVLKDPSSIFKNVRNGETINAKDVDITFETDVSGKAEADSVRSVTTDTTVGQ